MELRPVDPLEIILPHGIVTTPLTLDQIGLIACMLCINKTKEANDALIKRLEDPATMAVVKQLKDMGVLSANSANNSITFNFDMTKLGL